MVDEFEKIVLWNSRKILDRIKRELFYSHLDWGCISKPLKGNSDDLANIHNPTIDEYKMTFSFDGKIKTIYDWWYSAIVKDKKGKFYFFILAFHPKWSFYRIVYLDSDQYQGNSGSLPDFPVIGEDSGNEIVYSEREDSIDILVSMASRSDHLARSSARCTIKAGESRLSLRTDRMAADITFASLGSVFWINRGREAIISPRNDTMSGFYDICQVSGFLTHGTMKTEVSGAGFNEHLLSFTPPERFWKRIDGIYLWTDQIYCTFGYLENKTGTRIYEYKDGAILIRETKEYLIPRDIKIQYLELDSQRRIPFKTRILAETTKGRLDVITQAIAETEKQVAFKIIGGHFFLNDGGELTLTNGYGQHSLH